MRRLLTALVVTSTIALVPVLALAGNQEIAEQIRQNLDSSGRMSHYKIGVKYQDGTAYLNGYVSSQEQMNIAQQIAHHTPGVTRVVNGLTVGENTSAIAQTATETPAQPSVRATETASSSASNPLRGDAAAKPGLMQTLFGSKSQNAPEKADRVPDTFTTTPVAAVSAETPIAEPKPVAAQSSKPIASARSSQQQVAMRQVNPQGVSGAPIPMQTATSAGPAPVRYDQPTMPNYAWPSYAAYPNYAAVTYPKQYSPTAWPYIGPFYPYPQVPMGWRKVSLEWSDGWWFLDFKDQPASCWQR